MAYSEADVENFRMFTNVSEYDARAWLDRFSSVDTAVQQFFDLEGVLPAVFAHSQQQQTSWDEGAWGADRDTYGPANRPPDFNIQGADQMDTQRPNSRVENWVNNSSLSEESQIQMATSQSLQQSGVIDSLQSFQRVDDDHHKADYQLTAFTGMAFDMGQSVPAPAEQRQRADDETPVFVRPSSSRDGHLSSLITILHSIPLAREVLIGRNSANIDFGSDPQWWNGARISNTEDSAEMDSMTDFYKALETFTETQRLVAALDNTDRAYVSADVLEKIVKDGQHGGNDLREFFKKWTQGGATPIWEENSGELRATFMSTLINKGEQNEEEAETLFTLAPNLSEETAGSDSLTSLLGRTFMEQGNGLGYLYFQQLAKVLMFELEPAGRGDRLSIKIPSTFNARMFMLDPPEQFSKVFLDHKELIQRQYEIEEQVRSSAFAKGPRGDVSCDKLLDAAIKHLGVKPTQLMGQKSEPDDSEENLMELDEDIPSISELIDERTKISKELKSLKAEIVEAQGHLNEEVAAAQEAIRQNHSKLEEIHNASIDEYPDSKYQLCGVATSYDTFYVRIQPRKQDEEDLLVNDEDDPEPQWWKVEFTHGNPCSFNHKKVREVQVRHAASDAREKILLVYANPEAVSEPHQELPPALNTFVEVDNENFKLELQAKEDPLDSQAMQTTIEVDPAYVDPPAYSDAPNWGGERDDENVPPQWGLGRLPTLPPRSAQADNSSMEAESSGASASERSAKDSGKDAVQEGPSKKRGSRWTGIKKVLARSKSRERRGQPAEDLLTDTVEQIKGATTMAPNGKLGVPGNEYADSKVKRHKHDN